MGARGSDHQGTAQPAATLDPGPPRAKPWLCVTVARRVVPVTAALLVVLPILTFAGAIIVNGLGRDAVGIVFAVGFTALALDALVLLLAVVALAVIGLRPGKMRGRR